ncbi:hypothetical protein PRZ48_005300 [Zasmidium cellare]|uniref:Uncharacterized protein n=1 Tax=Zasmidium cellare TaxID=395010 RepID=A0ABR0ES18_ZASCE|nr:hypothetical protein PRZ48_005300 [Zasmidium cellare]
MSAFNIVLTMLLLIPLLGLTGVNAAPITGNAATCSVTLTSVNHGSAMANYSVNIARPFVEGGGCGPINQTLMEGVGIGVYKYQCFTTDNGASTNLSFVSATGPVTNIEVIDSLQKAYPMVPFQKQRICLMDGVDAPSSWPSPASKRATGSFDHIITAEVDAALRESGIVQRTSSIVGLFFGDLDLDQETVDAIMNARKMSTATNRPAKRNHNCDPNEPHSCDFHPENTTCLMTTGCHDDWIPANDSAICFYRVGWYDVRIGKPHLNCSGAAFVRDMLRETLPVGELTSITPGDVDFQCYEGPNDTTNLAIGVPNVYGDDVNSGLNLAYPGVGFNLNISPKCKDIIDGPWSGASCRT